VLRLGVLVWHNRIQLPVMLGIAATMLLLFQAELRGLSQHMSRRDLTVDPAVCLCWR